MDVAPIVTLLGTVVTAIGTIGAVLLTIWGTKLAYAKITGR